MPHSFAERLERELLDHALTDDVRAGLEGWLKADRDFNVWFLVTTKRALKDAELSALLDGYQDVQELVEAAWRSYGATKEPGPLLDAVSRSVDRMAELRAL